jgi:hypothetical protein
MLILNIIVKSLNFKFYVFNRDECTLENIKMVFACNQLFDFYMTILFVGHD